MIKILCLSPHPIAGPSPRYRIYAYSDQLKRRDINLMVYPFMSPRVFDIRIHGNKNPPLVFARVAMAFIERIFQALVLTKNYDAIYIHRQAFPVLQSIFDNFFIRSGVPFVFDMDDAVFTEYPIDHLLRARNCVGATVGNQYLADYVKSVAPSLPTYVIPTVVDTNIFRPSQKQTASEKRIIVGWIGTPSTYNQYLAPVIERIVRVCGEHNAEFRVICSPAVKDAANKAGAKFVPWSLQSEVSELQDLDVGLMPLKDDYYVRGKCAFKLIQYGAVGIPSIGTDIGANGEVIEHGFNGFLSKTPEEMEEFLSLLLLNPSLRDTMGKNARAVALEKFSLDSQVDRMANILLSAVPNKDIK